jgi:hypothetical protein
LKSIIFNLLIDAAYGGTAQSAQLRISGNADLAGLNVLPRARQLLSTR